MRVRGNTTSRARIVGALCLGVVATPSAPVASALSAVPGDKAAIVHILNRLAYGPRPGDVETIQARGLSAWIDRQLQPEQVPERGLEARLASLETTGLSSAELLKGYEIPMEAKREARKKLTELLAG